MPNPTDQDRLTSKNAGSNVVDLDAYRQASADAGNVDTSKGYIAPRMMQILIIAAILFCLAFILRIRV